MSQIRPAIKAMLSDVKNVILEVEYVSYDDVFGGTDGERGII